ncbi:hypothetical protein [Neisseria shayeganii]|uniref:Uncharacterized protein n=1 Tax=Neisseria shayeganii 871 TaxID=1032488 RepID=G4CH79_9NEIS|nr:hypothetical protein [Neisseria shayeganii]EGY52789.1 hypothetical protein HMPREF9371_0968 [Neisseria shayeganii 871]
MEKSSYVLLNIFLLLFWALLAFLSPSYLSPLRQEPLLFREVVLHHHGGKKSMVYFEADAQKYFMLCRNFEDQNSRNFCERPFPLHAREIEVDLLQKGLYRSSAHTVIIKKIRFAEAGEPDFSLPQVAYDGAFAYEFNAHYGVRTVMLLSFLGLYGVYRYRSKRSAGQIENNWQR